MKSQESCLKHRRGGSDKMVDSDLQSGLENRGCTKGLAESHRCTSPIRRTVEGSAETTEGLVSSASQEKCLQRY